MGGREEPTTRARTAGWREALGYCARPHHLRRTSLISLVVGLLLCAINQLGLILAGQATAATWLRCGLDFVVPFTVSNLGLLAGRAGAREPRPGGEAGSRGASIDQRRESP